MKTTILIAAIIAGIGIKASAEPYDFTGFNELKVEGGIELNVVVGPGFSVEAIARRGNLDRLELDQDGDLLTIRREDRLRLLGQGNRDRFIVNVTLPELTELTSTSGSDANVTGANADGMQLTASSGASIDMDLPLTGSLVAVSSFGSSIRVAQGTLGDVTLEASGGASVRIAGSCVGMDAVSSGGASVQAANFACDTVDLEASGGASIRAHADQDATVKASGGASVRLGGDASAIESDITSGASFRQTRG